MFARLKHQPPLSSLASLAWLALAAGLLPAAGCGRKSAPVEAPPPTANSAAPVPGGPPVYTPPTPAATTPSVSSDGGVDLRKLNHAYIGWIVQNRQRPKTFEEFVAKSGLPVPPAPPGKKFFIDRNGFIALINQ